MDEAVVKKRGRPKGAPKVGGRVKGTPNKVTSDIREMLKASLDKVGGQKYFERQAMDNPVAYMGLIGKIIPQEVRQEITGKDGGPIETRGVPRLSKAEWLAAHGLGTAERTADERD